jgi:hypothetical protein
MNKWTVFHMIMQQHAPRTGLNRIIEHPRAMHETISANLNIRQISKRIHFTTTMQQEIITLYKENSLLMSLCIKTYQINI